LTAYSCICWLFHRTWKWLNARYSYKLYSWWWVRKTLETCRV